MTTPSTACSSASSLQGIRVPISLFLEGVLVLGPFGQSPLRRYGAPASTWWRGVVYATPLGPDRKSDTDTTLAVPAVLLATIDVTRPGCSLFTPGVCVQAHVATERGQ